MPVISAFYGLIVRMFFYDNDRHHLPHIHVEYAETKAVIAIETGEILEGSLPANKRKLLDAWVELHREELMADWTLAVSGDAPMKIAPLV
jgi:Domain of unknown function (DUF4160)